MSSPRAWVKLALQRASKWSRVRAGRPAALGDQGGFTLIELTLVIVIIAVFAGLLIPRFRDPGRQELQAQAHRLVMVFKLLRSEAILHETEYRLNYDLDGDRYWITTEDKRANLSNFSTELGPLARETRLGGGRWPITIADVAFPTYGAKVSQGQIYTTFAPDGTIDPTVIHLSNETQTVTLHVDIMSNRLIMTFGYQEPRYN